MSRFLFALLLASLLLGSGSTAATAQNFHCNQAHMHPNQVLSPAQVGIAYSQHVWLTPANPYFCQWSSTPSPAFPNVFLVPGPNAWEAYLVGTPTTPGNYTFSVTGGCTYVLGTICPLTKTYNVTVIP